jgi:hypothetical protein
MGTQAYTNELENKISQLEEENERLRGHKVCIIHKSNHTSKFYYTI